MRLVYKTLETGMDDCAERREEGEDEWETNYET